MYNFHFNESRKSDKNLNVVLSRIITSARHQAHRRVGGMPPAHNARCTGSVRVAGTRCIKYNNKIYCYASYMYGARTRVDCFITVRILGWDLINYCYSTPLLRHHVMVAYNTIMS